MRNYFKIFAGIIYLLFTLRYIPFFYAIRKKVDARCIFKNWELPFIEWALYEKIDGSPKVYSNKSK